MAADLLSVVFFCLLALTLPEVRAEEQELDACIQYTNLTDWMRSVAYENDDYEHENLCDRQLDEGWYRAVSGAGGDMPTSPPPGFNRCGTVYPIWLNAELPQGEGTIVDAYACVFGVFSDCDNVIPILIKNCSDYNVYFLKQTDACPEAYCFGEERKCHPGYSSPTGFTPGCFGSDPPVLTEKPTLAVDVRETVTETGVTIYDIIFQCSIETPDIDRELWFDVTYYIGNTKVYEITDIAEDDLPAELPESEFATFQDPLTHEPNLGYGNNLTCVIGAKWSVDNDTGKGVDISEHYGFEVLSDLPIRLKEGEEQEIVVRSRLPINCPSSDTNCAIFVELHVPQFHEDFKQCEMDDQGSHLVMASSGCKLDLMEDNWDSGGSIGVKPEIKGVVGKEARSLIAKFYSQKASWKRSLSNLALPPIPVTVYEKGFTPNLYCEARCDPHMYLYTGSAHWEMHKTGIFILYTNKRFDTEVQIATEPCNGAATCVCAVVIRSGLTVFVLDSCKDRNQGGQVGDTEPPRAKMYDCHEGRSEMLIEKKSDKDYVFTLATKTEVKVSFQAYKTNYHNVYITPSVEDYMNAYGLCGYITEDGKTEKRLRTDNPTNDENLFSEDWKATANESLWLGKSTSPEEPVFYCGCSETEDEVVCENTMDHVDCVDKIFTDKEYGACRDKKARRRIALLTGKAPRNFGVVDDDDDVVIDWEDEDFVPEEPSWKNGWTEETAKEYCENYIMGRSSVQACSDVPDVDFEGSVELCVLDIYLTGDTDASDTHVDATKGQCLSVASRNLTMWESNADGNGTVVPPADIIEAGCLNECYDRGTCDKGVCTCFEGFSGVDCGTNDTAVPQLYKLPYRGVCDLQDWSCEATMAYGFDLFNSANLTCRVQQFQVTEGGLIAGSTSDVESYLERPSAAVCLLDLVKRTTQIMELNDDVLGFAYGVQVSNDGQNFGNRLSMVAFDSKCANCSNEAYTDISCVAKERICKIQGQCFDDGEAKDPGQQCLKCRVDATDDDWTLEGGTCFISSQCYNDGEENPSEGQSCWTCATGSSVSDWTQKAGTCFIDNQCYEQGDENPNPGQSCFACDVDGSSSDWTQTDQTCFIENQCYDDTEGHPTEQCAACQADTSTGDWTVTDENSCFIDHTCYANNAPHPAETCVSCRVADSVLDWSLNDFRMCYIEGRCYDDLEASEDKECQLCVPQGDNFQWTIIGCLIDDICRSSGEVNPDNTCQLCSPKDSQTSWTPLEGCAVPFFPDVDRMLNGASNVSPITPLALALGLLALLIAV